MIAGADLVRGDAEGVVRAAVRMLGAGSVKAGVGRLARLLGMRERRVRAYLHGEVRNPLAWEVAALRARLADVAGERQARADQETAALDAALRRLEGER